MAAKKKRSRGLSGSPEHHAGEADKRYREARERYNYVIDSAQNKKCASAFQILMRAERFDGSATSHDRESGGKARAAATQTAKSAMLAEAAFRENCLVGAGLSGMKRRSRR